MLRKSLILFICIAGVICSPGLWDAAAGIGALSSVSAVLYEPDSKRVLYGKDADSPRPMASTTKIMTALLAIELSPLDRVITVPEQAVRVELVARSQRRRQDPCWIWLPACCLIRQRAAKPSHLRSGKH